MSNGVRFSASFVRDVVLYAAARGVEIDELCAAIGISRALLTTPDEPVAGSVYERSWQIAMERTGDPDFGLHLGESVHPSMLGLLGFVMLSCETVGAAIERLIRYWNTINRATTLSLSREGMEAALEWSVVDLPGNFLLHNPRQSAESASAAMLSIARALAGRPLPLMRVEFAHPRPARTVEHDRLFGGPPVFGAALTRMTFRAEALAWPVLQANSALLEGFETQIARRVHQEPDSLADRVRQEIGRRLRGEAPELSAIARALRVSERALQRELQQLGVSFRQLLDELRRDLALEYLKNQQASIAEVSFLLGFSEPSAFHRSFRKWTGVTPQAFRRG
ncbi:MAG: AraC family transcriptional regulator [Acidobacteria bacterium]|nr:AraC family transcriptional regulator [Acidobacteriota bacterium]